MQARGLFCTLFQSEFRIFSHIILKMKKKHAPSLDSGEVFFGKLKERPAQNPTHFLGLLSGADFFRASK